MPKAYERVISPMGRLISFKLGGRFGHFLQAEAGASALSYPIPPRTAIIGMIGAVLGLEKDQPQQVLEPMSISLSGGIPMTHWHKAKFRKDPPEALPSKVLRAQKAEKTTKPEQATLISQEWLINPAYCVWVSLPAGYCDEFERRLVERRWYYQPCLGISEMMANLEYMETVEAKLMPYGSYDVASVIRQREAELDIYSISVEGSELAVQLLRMPRVVTADRVFTHESYFIEKKGQPIRVKTGCAYKAGERVLMFL
jgi:CRISPR-associated protein Cas5h